MRASLAVTIVASIVAFSATTGAQASMKQSTAIPPQELAGALRTLVKEREFQIIYSSELLADRRTQGASGELTLNEALEKLLGGTGLTYRYVDEKTVSIVLATQPAKAEPAAPSAKPQAPNLSTRIPDGVQKRSFWDRFRVAQASGATVETSEPASDGTEGVKLDEIVVTAQKRQENVQEVPISIAVLSGAVLDNRGINDLQDLSHAVPGLFAQDSGFERNVSIRGIGNIFGSSSTIGSYIDEAVAIGLRGDRQLDIQIYDLARVEVLRGPQGTLYGQGSMGGTIRYITADPDLTRVTGQMDLSGSFTEDGDPTERLRGTLNLPLASDTLGIRVAGIYENVGGWMDQPALSKDNINDRELMSVRTKALWRPVEALDVTAMMIVHRDDRGASGVGADEEGNFQQSLLLPTTPSASVDYEFYNLTVSYDFPAVRLLGTSTFLNYDSELRDRGNQCCTPTPSIDGQWMIGRQVVTGEALTQEIRLVSAGSGRLEWTVGGFYQDAEYFEDQGPAEDNLFGVPGGTLGVDLFNFTGYSDANSKSWAAFGEVSYAFTDKLSMGAGLRYFEDDAQLRSAPGQTPQFGTFDSTNPKVFLSYAASDAVNLYASMAKGFRSGGFNAAGQPPYEPEELWSYELGTKMSLLDRRVSLELALTRSDYDEYQIIGFIPGFIGNITSNAGKARVQGVDGLLIWRAVDDLELGLSASYVDTEFTEINATSSSHAVGDPLDMVPEYGASLWAEYRFNWPAGSGSPGFARLDYSQQGIAHFRNRSFADTYHSTSDVLGLLNARLGWARDRWTAELYVQNLLDENGFDDPLSVERSATRVWPRTYGVRVGIDFE